MTDSHSDCARLYAFEGAFSLTGANADHRFALRSADIALVAAALAGQIAPNRLSGAAAVEALKALDATLPEDWSGQTYSKVIAAVADDLKANRGRCLVIAGPRQPAEVHVLVHLLNEELGNTGKTVAYSPLTPGPTHLEAIAALSDEMKAGHVDTLVIIGGNPVYNAPADLAFAEALKRVPNSVHLGAHPDETAVLCSWHLPRAHYLESWGDGRAWDGTVSVCQPLIEPLFDGRSAIELLAMVIGDEKTAGYDIVRRTFAAEFTNADRFEKDWRKTIHDGVLVNASRMQWQLGAPGLQAGAAGDAVQRLAKRGAPASGDSFELIFAPDTHAYDGRYTNNGWLMEMPDPLTKLTWDNAVVIGYGAAKRLNVKTGDRMRITAAGGSRSMEAAVQMIPGVHDRVAVLSLGFGRAFPGRVCKDAGFNFYQLRTSDAMGFAAGATLQKIDGTYPLATTQDHHTIDVNSVGGIGVQERLAQLYREADLKEYQKEPDFARHRAHVVHRLSLWNEDKPFQSADGFPGARHAWAMSIDLSSCVGCGACMIACQAENNIPVVGKDQVIRGREMQWIRIDRYFRFKKTAGAADGGTAYDPSAVEQAALQPVTCMHCENAPCEQVCPVAATVHDADGLNVMAYNRCIGTRYCSNNCPYKVRRFNYFDYQCREPVRETGMWFVKPDYYIEPQSDTPPLQRMQFNPEVTVRSRGVMEKCTYCVQRITKAKIKAKNDVVRRATAAGRAVSTDPIIIDDSAVTPACAQACPAQAIVFGDLLNPASQVLKAHRHERSYGMLDDINTKPRTKYLARIRNPNTDLVPPAPAGGHDQDHAQPEASKHG
jgi:molybdopterin-containing oxidoreductase family iron-sulfur binding subunit